MAGDEPKADASEVAVEPPELLNENAEAFSVVVEKPAASTGDVLPIEKEEGETENPE